MADSEKGRSAIDTVKKAFERVINFLIASLLACMVFLVFGNVISRYFLQISIGWSEEVSRFMLIWLAFLGAVIAYLKNEHLGLDVLHKYLPRFASLILLVIADLFVLAALAFMTKGGFDMTLDSLQSGWVSSAVPIPYGYVYMVAPISTALMFLEGLLKLAEDVKKLIANKALGAN
ncbi:MAG: TRAP transporter small permease [Treponemataceae bacterium]